MVIYEKVENKYYGFDKNGLRFGPLDKLAVLVILDDQAIPMPTILSHGKPESVAHEYWRRYGEMVDNGLAEASNDMAYIEGHFDVDQFNKALSVPFSVHAFLKDGIQEAKAMVPPIPMPKAA